MKTLTKTLFVSLIYSLIFLSRCINSITIDKVLMKTASEINESCPMMIDKDTRLDNTIALTGNTIQYNYTMVNFTKSELDIEVFTSQLTSQITNDVKTNPGLKAFRDNGVTMVYYYKDKTGVFITKISITPKDYK